MKSRILLFSILLFSSYIKSSGDGRPNKGKEQVSASWPIRIIGPPVYAIVIGIILNSKRP